MSLISYKYTRLAVRNLEFCTKKDLPTSALDLHLLVGVFSVLPDLVWRITEQWYAGDVMCRIVKFLQCLVTYGSTFVLVALSIDRFDAIARPLNFSRRRRCKILIAVAWGIAAIFSSPSLILFHFAQNQCVIQLGPLVYWQKTSKDGLLQIKKFNIYITLIAFVVFFIPAIIITFCYGAIIYVIWRHNKVLYSINQYKADRNLEKPLYPKDEFKSKQEQPQPIKIMINSLHLTFIVLDMIRLNAIYLAKKRKICTTCRGVED
ncbi:hypothetical protein KUTeg_001640 [Tegillarca granosa]|uniref:G-protein coupled receptors family 1 profile domain-containing protein n=1 Tax=Tegillarca granosa TaxID=220873 RepID=A0ABQ9FWG9_TEGGR|nr:hypothetical protein KUTeg_001640 [Tegillarca granosa]